MISPGPAPAIFVEADLGPAVGAGPVLIAPGPGADAGRWQAPGHCEATAYLPPPPGPITNAKHAGDPAVSILIERADGVRPSGSALIAPPTPSQLGSGRAARLGGGRRRHHGPRQPGRAGAVLTVRLPVATEDHLSGRAVADPRQVRAAGGMRPSPGLRRRRRWHSATLPVSARASLPAPRFAAFSSLLPAGLDAFVPAGMEAIVSSQP